MRAATRQFSHKSPPDRSLLVVSQLLRTGPHGNRKVFPLRNDLNHVVAKPEVHQEVFKITTRWSAVGSRWMWLALTVVHAGNTLELLLGELRGIVRGGAVSHADQKDIRSRKKRNFLRGQRYPVVTQNNFVGFENEDSASALQ